MQCKKCGRELKENERCSCEVEKKGFVKRGASKLLGVLKRKGS